MLAFAGGGTWQTIDVNKPDKVEVAEVAKAEKIKTNNPFLRQVQDQAPQLFPERDDAEVCGNCIEFKVSGGKGRCGLRYLQVGATDPACEYFDMAERGDDDEDEEDGDWENDD